jgi:hypothetical protein
MSKQQEPKQKYTSGTRVRIVATKDKTFPESKKHEGRVGRVSVCKPTERPVAFLYDVVLDADETTLQLLPESCLEKVQDSM